MTTTTSAGPAAGGQSFGLAPNLSLLWARFERAAAAGFGAVELWPRLAAAR